MDYKRLQNLPDTNVQEVSYYEHNTMIYDNLPYERDYDLCNLSFLHDHGSQIIQVYRFDTEPYKISNSK